MERGLLIYLPGYTGDDPNELDRRGLSVLREPGLHELVLPVSHGPDGGHGRLVIFDNPARPDLASDHSYAADKQEWFDATVGNDTKPTDSYWIGYTRGARPGPESLGRRTTHDGLPVTLRDGKQWVIPIADYLPKLLAVDRQMGEEIERIAPEHEDFVRASQAMFDLFMSQAFLLGMERDGVIRIPNGLKYAAAALSKNYRVNRDVVDFLGLVGGLEACEVAKIAVGVPLIHQMVAEKKNTVPSRP